MRSWNRRCALAGMGALLWPALARASGLWPRLRRLPAWLTAFDQLARPGESVSLTVKLYQTTRFGFHINLHDRPITFHCPPLPEWETQTGEDGLACAEVRAPVDTPELWRFSARYGGGNCYEPVRACGRVFLWPADTAILVTDVDGTVSDLHEFRVPFTSNRNTPTLPCAAESLRALAQRYRVVYLTARDETLCDRTRDWLAVKGFPSGPLFCRDMSLVDSAEGFKQQFLAELAKRYPGLAVGVGDRPGDARAYLANGMQAFLIDPSGKVEAPAGSVVVPSWRTLRRRLEQTGPLLRNPQR